MHGFARGGIRHTGAEGTADGLPLVGPAGPEHLWLASGHFRNGILLAPMTAELIRAALERFLNFHDGIGTP